MDECSKHRPSRPSGLRWRRHPPTISRRALISPTLDGLMVLSSPPPMSSSFRSRSSRDLSVNSLRRLLHSASGIEWLLVAVTLITDQRLAALIQEESLHEKHLSVRVGKLARRSHDGHRDSQFQQSQLILVRDATCRPAISIDEAVVINQSDCQGVEDLPLWDSGPQSRDRRCPPEDLDLSFSSTDWN